MHAANGEPRAILHFSYGANMSSAVLQKRGLTPLSNVPAQATDPRVAISFRHRGGFATLLLPPDTRRQPATETCAALDSAGPHGVLYSLTQEDLQVRPKGPVPWLRPAAGVPNARRSIRTE